MSFSVDVNILIYSINKDSEWHTRAKVFLEKMARAPETWVMPWPVAHSFLRITTHAGILPNPLAPSQAVFVLDSLIGQPNIRFVSETDLFWSAYKKEVLSGHFRGSAISDVIIAAIMKEHGVGTLYTADRDFLRFKGIRSINPLISGAG
ncbi:MAG: PIN domain-containing protein [Chitinivibrionales bacterium]|nr:PIN domain-containing protein [Chitinivibrionales bacterium]